MSDGLRTSDRVVQSPCEWCGAAIEHVPRGGRRRLYCSQACRQRAYEARTAARRLDRDLEAERHRPAPAERVVERVIEPEAPRQISAWVEMLEHLIDALDTGAIAWHQQARVRELLVEADAVIARNARRFPQYFLGARRFMSSPQSGAVQAKSPVPARPAPPVQPQPLVRTFEDPYRTVAAPAGDGRNRAERRAAERVRKKFG